MARGVHDEVVEAPADVPLDLGHGVLGVVGDDPALGDVLVRKLVGETLHLNRVVDAVLLLRGQRQGGPEAAVGQAASASRS